MTERPTSHECGYHDGRPGTVIWDGTHGRCDRCGVQFTAEPTLDELLDNGKS